MFLKIFSYLTPEAVANLALVNQSFKVITRNHLFWQEKFHKHFPYRMQSLFISSQMNWHEQFQVTYLEEYKDLTSYIRKLFSFFKENDIESLKMGKVQLVDLAHEDRSSHFLLEWTSSQSILDYCYQIAEEEYKDEKQ